MRTVTITDGTAKGVVNPVGAVSVASGSQLNISILVDKKSSVTVSGTCGGSPSAITNPDQVNAQTFVYKTNAVTANCTVIVN